MSLASAREPWSESFHAPRFSSVWSDSDRAQTKTAGPVNVDGVLADLQHMPRVATVRFNQRVNAFLGCDAGWGMPNGSALAGERFGPICPLRGLRHGYTSTVCFSDMNHLARTSFYRDHVLPAIRANPTATPENAVQSLLRSLPHPSPVVVLFGEPQAAATTFHLDGRRAVMATADRLCWASGVNQRCGDLASWMEEKAYEWEQQRRRWRNGCLGLAVGGGCAALCVTVL